MQHATVTAFFYGDVREGLAWLRWSSNRQRPKDRWCFARANVFVLRLFFSRALTNVRSFHSVTRVPAFNSVGTGGTFGFS